MIETQYYDIAIIGAGPAGSTCALALRKSGLCVVLLDKHEFPRDKICGDAIPARAIRVLREVALSAVERLGELEKKTIIRACKTIAPNGKHFTYHFETPGYCVRRMDFDAFLVKEVLQYKNIDFLPQYAVENIQRTHDLWLLQTSKGDIQAKLIIGCDGANGITAKQLGGIALDPQHHCAAVRAYYGGVKDLQRDTMEIYLLQNWLPGYFWIFPLNENECNVGFGMLTEHIAQRKIALRPAIAEIIAQYPALKERFQDAHLQGKVQGFGLPLGSRSVQMSGEGFLLCGDAASLIDPATGEGI